MPLFLLRLAKYWRALTLLAILVGLGVSHWTAYNRGVEKERNRNVTRVVEIREDLNEIRNMRPDDVELVDRLLDGDF